ncbi:MAG: hypothetical protein Q4G51_07005 [Dermatophilus congolensis]|nr:hypothetical protein [Dermatophilus congolensis]
MLTFTREARRALLSDGAFDKDTCAGRAADLQSAISPDDVYAAALAVGDPDLQALVLNAREKVGSALRRCALGVVADRDAAIGAVALVDARVEEQP